jgi:hypothetical protein
MNENICYIFVRNEREEKIEPNYIQKILIFDK